jgi:hypothetical protein
MHTSRPALRRAPPASRSRSHAGVGWLAGPHDQLDVLDRHHPPGLTTGPSPKRRPGRSMVDEQQAFVDEIERGRR